MNMTIAGVKPPNPFNDAYYVNGVFDNGDDFSVWRKDLASAEACVKELEALIGKPGEFDLEPKPDRNGRKQWKVKSWPGKPSFGGGFKGGGGGGGRPYVPAYSQSQEAFEIQQRSIQRSVALERAIQWAMNTSKGQIGAVFDYANQFYEWLSKPASDKPHTPTPRHETTDSATPVGGGMNIKEEPKVSQEYFVWESAAKTLQAKHSDLWPTWQDALAELRPQLQAMGLGTPRLLKECHEESKFASLLKAMKNKIADSVPF